MKVCERFRLERERLGLNQTQLGDLLGAGKTTVIRWEKGSGAPDADQLALFAEAGADVQYILTGRRQANQGLAGYEVDFLSADERTLVENYRKATDEGKAMLEAASEALIKKPTKKRGPSM
jgi:transcriptional regulator with XRE-family HTH domain